MTCPATAVLGRDDAIATVTAHLARHRLVTLVGVGGIGKTTLARAVAAACAPSFADGVAFVDLARLSAPEHLPSACAAALGLAVDVGPEVPDAYRVLASRLRGRRRLVVLDNCEPMIEAAARLVAAMLREGDTGILATSREPLGVGGEVLHRVSPLPYPPPAREARPETLQAYPAVALLLQRAGLADPGPGDLAGASELCRRLDGLPLAIELAAAHVRSLGLGALVAQMGDRLLSLAAGADGPSATRHHTLQATLAWSHALLTTDERRALRRLAVFRSRFDLAAAVRVLADSALPEEAALEALAGLAAKSLLQVERGARDASYRLLETTRAFAGEKLAADADRGAVRRRHAADCRERLTEAERDWSRTSDSGAWMQRHGHLIDEVRAAFDWAADDATEPALAAELLLAALPLAGRLALTREFIGRLQRLLAWEPVAAWATPVVESRLCTALGELHCMCNAHEQGARAYARAQALAEALDTAEARVSACVGLWVTSHFSGRYPEMARAAQALVREVALRPDPGTEVFAHRATAYALHYLGDHVGATAAARQALAHPVAHAPASHMLHSMIDREVAMRVVQARTLWLRGFPDLARAMADEALEHATHDRATAQGVVLAIAACPIALWRGDDDAAQAMVLQLLRPEAQQAGLYGVAWARQYQRVLDRRAARPDPHDDPAADTVALDMLATLDEALLVPSALARVQRGEVGWCAPEVLRARAGQLRRAAAPPRDEIGALLGRALTMARFQGALSWELRAATSLAAGAGRAGAETALLEAVVGRFTEGHDTADLRAAKRLLDQLL